MGSGDSCCSRRNTPLARVGYPAEFGRFRSNGTSIGGVAISWERWKSSEMAKILSKCIIWKN